jgi:hypothetical protein
MTLGRAAVEGLEGRRVPRKRANRSHDGPFAGVLIRSRCGVAVAGEERNACVRPGVAVEQVGYTG